MLIQLPFPLLPFALFLTHQKAFFSAFSCLSLFCLSLLSSALGGLLPPQSSAVSTSLHLSAYTPLPSLATRTCLR